MSEYRTRVSSTRRRLIRYAYIMGALALLASIGGTSLILRSHAADKETKADATASPGASDPGAVGIGYADVRHGLIPLMPTQPGRVIEVPAEENVKVAKDTPLLKIDDRDARLQLGRAEEELKAAHNTLSLAKKGKEAHEIDLQMQQVAIDVKQEELDEAKRQQKKIADKPNVYGTAAAETAEHGVKLLEKALEVEKLRLKKLQLDDPEALVAKAQADVDAKIKQRDRAQLAVDECVLKAPMDGTVVRVATSPGDVFGSPTKAPALIFCPEEPRIIRVEIDQEFARRVKIGQIASMIDDTRNTAASWHGKVTSIADVFAERRNMVQNPFQFNDVRTMECLIELEPGQEMLRINQRVRVTLRNP